MPEFTIRRRLLAVLAPLIAAVAMTPSVAKAGFGISSFTMSSSSPQAGAHADQTTSFSVTTDEVGNPTGQLEDATVTLPPGTVGNPLATPRCAILAFKRFQCPAATQVGILETAFMICPGAQQPLTVEALAGETTITVKDAQTVYCAGSSGVATIGSGPTAERVSLDGTENGVVFLAAPLEHNHSVGEEVKRVAEWFPVPLPLYNLQPLPGHQASFGAQFIFATLLVNVDLPNGGSGGLKATIEDASTLLGIKGAAMTLWGVPSEPRHDEQRCIGLLFTCNQPGGEPAPFMSNPSDCSTPLEGTVTATSYEGESATARATLPAPTGCEALQISPTISVAPDTTTRDIPAGYEVDVKVPQSNHPEGLATPPLKDVSVTLPAGTSLSPSMANGLQACSEAQFTASDCPDASKVGTATLSTPLLPDALTGAIYVGEPSATEKYPLRVLLSGDGTTIRLRGQAEPDASSGQVTTVFANTPQLPFSDLKLDLFGGPTAVLANPETCGPAKSSARILSYAGQLATPSSTFIVDGGGGACPPNETFTPRFTAGTTSPLAAEFSPFTLTVSRADGEPSLTAFSAQLAPGLLGLLKSVPVCPEPQAAQGACPQDSRVGTATVLAGAGSVPLPVSGSVYLTGPYAGAPLGLVTTIHAAAGPFDLGTAVVRSRISIDPRDLHLTIATDPFPRIMGGVPLRMKALNITLDRPGFILNPTSCSAMTISGIVEGIGGAKAAVSSPFDVAGCDSLPFAPRLRASTRAGAGVFGNGASLYVKIITPAQSTGTMHSASIQLPKQLRPRLTTTQSACLETAVKNLGECPSAARVGSAKVVSPVIAAPLIGSVLLVAHGGASAPSLVLLLHAEGVNVELRATLSVNKRGPIKATFSSLPDVPITTFELALPAGPGSLLGSRADVCHGPLVMPYKLTDESGALAAGSVHIAVSGCAKHKAAHPAKALPRASHR